jgi:hypothetical protein
LNEEMEASPLLGRGLGEGYEGQGGNLKAIIKIDDN